MTPLHIQIALHYHASCEQFELVLSNSTRREFAEDLVKAGMLERVIEGPPGNSRMIGFRGTDGLAMFVEALCSTPFPVKQWTMPAHVFFPQEARHGEG